MKTEAHHLLDAGSTPGQMAAELGINRSTAEAIAHSYYAPRWPVFLPEALARLPEHLRRKIEATNPNHKRTT